LFNQPEALFFRCPFIHRLSVVIRMDRNRRHASAPSVQAKQAERFAPFSITEAAFEI
jgi:hypothetical protein